jgi:glycosyltransferase involved in cell wall biosynthesis
MSIYDIIDEATQLTFGHSPLPEKALRRILILVHHYPPTYTGGAEQRAARTAQALQRRGYEVYVLCVESITSEQAELHWSDNVQDGIRVRRLSFCYSEGEDGFRESYDNPYTRQGLTSLLESWQPDLVYLFSGYLMSASVVDVAKAHDIPIVVALTDYWWFCHRMHLLRHDGARCGGPEPVACARCQAEIYRRFRAPARALPAATDLFWSTAKAIRPLADMLGVPEQQRRAAMLIRSLNMADGLISPSRYLAEAYIRNGADPARMHVCRQGVDENLCLLRVPAVEIRIGYLGQMKPHKGVHLLLEAWGKLSGPRPRRLILYGSGFGEDSYSTRLRAQIARYTDVSWNGNFVGKHVWQVLAEIDAVVVPSRWAENSPNTILEAQAVGVPVIGSDLGGIAELVQHEENGLLFEPDSSDDLARQLQRLLDDPGLLQRLHYADIPFHTTDEQLDHVIGLFEQLVGTRRASGSARAASP